MEGKPEPEHGVFAAPGDTNSVSVVVEKGERKETTKKEISTVGVARRVGGRWRGVDSAGEEKRERCCGCGGGAEGCVGCAWGG